MNWIYKLSQNFDATDNSKTPIKTTLPVNATPSPTTTRAKLTPKQISSVIKKVKLNKFSGNCGTFAIALAQFLKEHGFINMKYIILSDAESLEDLFYADRFFYHVFLYVDEIDTIFDGSGIPQIPAVNDILSEYGSHLSVANRFDVPCDRKSEMEIRSNTDYFIGEYVFLERLRQVLPAENAPTTDMDTLFGKHNPKS